MLGWRLPWLLRRCIPVGMLVLTLGGLPSLSACAARPPAATTTARVGAPSLIARRVAITGVIVNGVTARPLPGAIIDLDDRPRSESGLDGTFHIDDVPVGVHLLGARARRFRSRLQPVDIVVPDADPDGGTHNHFIVLLFAPSGYFSGFPRLGTTAACRSEADCPRDHICVMNNFKEGDAPVCTIPVPCKSEGDCKLGQQCEPVTLLSREQVRVCQGQPAPEGEP